MKCDLGVSTTGNIHADFEGKNVFNK